MEKSTNNAALRRLWRAYRERNARYEAMAQKQRELYDEESYAIRVHNANLGKRGEKKNG